jgi:demethylmenaquinone methyltransferase/2-methoxy-6-polyprenyl-1,4-benzoquinol methylase
MNKGLQDIFSAVPATYELINHILTLGFDTPVRRYAARCAAAHQARPARWLDACTGTGDMARHLAKYAGQDTLLMASDFTLPMLRYAGRLKNSSARFMAADSARLPFRDNSFDLVTISFAARNINISSRNLTACLKEFLRVLKPGGRFICLETSQPRSLLLRKLLRLFVQTCVRPVGAAVSGSKAAYAYLSQTVPRFYNADELSEIILESGFGECQYKLVLGGLAAIHRGIKK